MSETENTRAYDSDDRLWHGVQMVAWLLKGGVDIMVSISVTEAMALTAALRTSCEHPGFTMLFTFIGGKETVISKERTDQLTHCIVFGKGEN